MMDSILEQSGPLLQSDQHLNSPFAACKRFKRLSNHGTDAPLQSTLTDGTPIRT